ncbi:MAG: hypothetical protein K2O00_08100, partial [Muribaculaceae bacterium]|nr:hypothetical protein [Muribaculaceae bacterium]
FETTALYTGILDKSLGMTAKPTYTRSTAKKLFNTAGGIFTYKYSGNRGGDAFWQYDGESTVQFYNDDVIGMYVNGDFSNHEVMVVVAAGTDEKSFSLGKLDFRGWRYMEVKLHDLLDETPYNLAGMRLVQDDNPVSQNGSFAADNMIVIPADQSGIAAIEDDQTGIALTIRDNILTASAPAGVSAMELIGTDGKLLISVKGNTLDCSALTPAVYLVRIIAADGSTAVRRVAID